MTTVAEPTVRIKARDDTQQAFRSVRQSLRGMESAAFQARKALGAIGATVSVGVIASGLIRAADAAIKYGDEMAKASTRTGIGAGQFAQLAAAAKLSDVEIGDLSRALRQMQISISQAGSGNKTAIESFKAIGVNVQFLKGLKPDDQLYRIADGLRAIKDPADRARVGSELFGRAWQTMAPFLDQGSEGIRKAREQIEKLGGALTDEQVQKLADADLAIKTLAASYQQFARGITADIAPSLTTLIERLNALRNISGQDFRSAFAQNGLFATWNDLAKASQGRQFREGQAARNASVWGGLDPAFMRQGVAQSRTAPGPQPADPKTPAAKAAKEVLTFAEAVQRTLQSLDSDTTNDVFRSIQGVANQTKRMAGELTEIWKPAQQGLSEYQEFALQAARNIQDSFAEFLFDPFAQGLDGMLKGFIDTLRRMVAEMLASQALKALFAWGAGLGGGTGAFFTALSGARASGGPVSAGGAYLVGERGPEVFVPRSSGNIIPNGGMGGITMNYTIDARGADAERIMAVLPAMLKRTKDETVAAVMDLQRRGRFA